jgi:ketosteroid isomerase-like protein
MRDPIAPVLATHPAEAVELVSVAVSDGDLEAALAQYERGAVLQPWAVSSGNAEAVGDCLRRLMLLRLPLSLEVSSVMPVGGLALVLGKRHIAGIGPDCELVDLTGLGATVVRRQPGGGWRIAVDAWQLSGAGGSLPG